MSLFIFGDKGPVSGRILSLETDLSPLITMATIVSSMLKITRGLKIFWETGPRGMLFNEPNCCLSVSVTSLNSCKTHRGILMVTAKSFRRHSRMLSEWVTALVYLPSLLNSQGLMSNGPGARQWDEGWKCPWLEYTEYTPVSNPGPSGLKSSALPLDQAHRHSRMDENCSDSVWMNRVWSPCAHA